MSNSPRQVLFINFTNLKLTKWFAKSFNSANWHVNHLLPHPPTNKENKVSSVITSRNAILLTKEKFHNHNTIIK